MSSVSMIFFIYLFYDFIPPTTARYYLKRQLFWYNISKNFIFYLSLSYLWFKKGKSIFLYYFFVFLRVKIPSYSWHFTQDSQLIWYILLRAMMAVIIYSVFYILKKPSPNFPYRHKFLMPDYICFIVISDELNLSLKQNYI